MVESARVVEGWGKPVRQIGWITSGIQSESRPQGRRQELEVFPDCRPARFRLFAGRDERDSGAPNHCL
jgi:hypothetical protein